jgi:hypothetical protein
MLVPVLSDDAECLYTKLGDVQIAQISIRLSGEIDHEDPNGDLLHRGR